VTISQYGTWTSPLDAATVAAAERSPKWVDVHGDTVWWAETRPTEGGRITLLREGPDGPVEVLPAPWNARNRVHEYGGRPWLVLDERTVVFTNWADQRMYLLDGDVPPRPVTPEPERPQGFRYSGLAPGPDGGVLCVRETVTGERPTDVRRDLVVVSTDGDVRVLGASHHFLAGARLSPDGRHLAWFGWDHPLMPWDGTELCVAELTADGLGPHRVLAGGPRESVCQVEWESADTLLALTDPDGWWNLFRIGLDGTSTNLAPCAKELGGPLWTLGARWFTPLGDGRFAVLRSGRLAVLDERAGTVTDVPTDLTVWSTDLAVAGTDVVAAAGGPRHDLAPVRFDLATGTARPLTERPEVVDPAYLPVPEERVFDGPDGRSVPALVYHPTNPEHRGPAESAPPFLVHVHGGPTNRSRPLLDLEFAYFTSRGIGVVAVNYGGSTGYGREFREALNEQWGVVDVLDSAAVATALAKEGVADGNALAVRGGSAGGWTSAASMTTVDTYRCGTIMYPILDLTAWTGDGGETHDFESRYLDGLVGTLPEQAERYRDRSPINKIDRLAGPVLLLQGLEDEICPPEQANRFVAGLAGSGVPHAYLTFEGEQHGFRKAETIVAALEAELSFYGQVFGFTPAGVPELDLRR
jgi:dipeptidyl aminopeptidase/acylaminoacyl peptidase